MSSETGIEYLNYAGVNPHHCTEFISNK